jgi:hypothetical protein
VRCDGKKTRKQEQYCLDDLACFLGMTITWNYLCLVSVHKEERESHGKV